MVASSLADHSDEGHFPTCPPGQEKRDEAEMFTSGAQFFVFFLNLKHPTLLSFKPAKIPDGRVILKMHKDASSLLQVHPFGCWVFSGSLVRVSVKGGAHPVFAAAGWSGGRWHTQALSTEENHR